jgi:hypothetical protein
MHCAVCTGGEHSFDERAVPPLFTALECLPEGVHRRILLG